MAGFDADPVNVVGGMDEDEVPNGMVDHQQYKTDLKNFLMHFGEGQFGFKYRDMLRRNYNVGQYWVEVRLEDIIQFNEELYSKIKASPSEFIEVFEEAAREVADNLTHPRPEGEEAMEDIQVMLVSDGEPSKLREMRSDQVSKLERIHGIVLTASGVRSKANRMSLMCRGCRSILPNITVKPGLEGYALPRKCTTNQGVQAGEVKCPLDPYFILPDRCSCVDFQIIKLQESPDCVPSGEMPRHMTMYCDRYLCERAVPGNRITVTGIYSIKKAAQTVSKKSSERNTVGVRIPYFRVFGIQQDLDGTGRSGKVTYSAQEEEKFRELANSPECYERIVKSIAPSIYGSEDIKKAIACLLFGGSRKRLPDGLTRRGDINVLLLGDPGTAKSQLLKFVEKASPIGVYTSGKGSSAAGLTASVNRDPATRNFVMEGGAMVLADGGIVCIDEFDKMREDDRVAIHEAMEQQTISIAKAGITTTLNSRCAVLAAANSIFGRWDDTKGDENIDFMPTILSRFDMIFIIKDEHSEQRDTILANHVIGVHMNAGRMTEQPQQEGELSMGFLKKYIAYCKSTCGPRMAQEASEKLKNKYVLMRSGNREAEEEAEKRNPIPITVRQLEAIVRMAEALAKMQLKPFATEAHIDEALRLFQVSTLEAASTGNLSGVEGYTTHEYQEKLSRIEHQLKRRMPIGAQVSEHTIMQDFLRQKHEEKDIRKVLQTMVRRGELQSRLQRKMYYRVK